MPNQTDTAIKRWSTADVSQPRRLDYFAAAIAQAIYPIGVDGADPRTFRAEVSSADFGAIHVCKVRGSAHSAYRRRSELARTSDHCFNLLMRQQSSWTADHRGHSRLRPRDVLIIDSQFPLEVVVDGPFVAVNVAVSETWLRQWLPNHNTLVGQRIPGNSLAGLALSSYLCELSPDLVAAPPLPVSVIADQVGSLLALTANGLNATIPAYTPPVRSLRARIEDYLMHRCTESQLTATDLAASLDISVRTLHRTFAATGETFGDKLIEARARVALRMLRSPLFNRVTTAEIGRRAGFLSASHFARVMRARTGRTPLQLRGAVGADRSASGLATNPDSSSPPLQN